MEPKAMWIIYNQGDEYEFAECAKCGHEQEPSGLPGVKGFKQKWYPKRCPKCEAKMAGTITAEDVDARTTIVV